MAHDEIRWSAMACANGTVLAGRDSNAGPRALTQRLVEPVIVVVDVWKKINLTTFDDHGVVSNQYRNRFVQADGFGRAAGHGGAYPLFGPLRLVVKNETRQRHGAFDPYAAVAEVAPVAVEKLRRGRMVQIDVHIVGENELDIAQGVALARTLAYAQLAKLRRIQAFAGQAGQHLPLRRDELEALLFKITGIA